MTALTEHRSFLSNILTRQYDRRRFIDPNHTFQPQPSITGYSPRRQDDSIDNGEGNQEPVAGPSKPSKPSKRQIVNYVQEEETIRNDLSGWYVQSGEFGSNHIHGAAEHEICEEYPALRRLMDLKAQHVDHHAHPPLHLPLNSTSTPEITSALGSGSNRFDVILLRPLGTWQETADLPIRSISADPGFVFLWVGKGDSEGLERGRECFAKWGFRRAEDIVWVKTNHNHRRTSALISDEKIDGGTDEGVEAEGAGSGGGGLFASSKEHCLMGIRGTVRRSTDSRFVHCNVDTDIIVHEPTSSSDGDTASFPPYLYTLIENFCLGARRLELFGNPSTARRGWVTASLPSTSPYPDPDTNAEIVEGTLPFDPTTYPSMIPQDPKPVVPFHPEIDQLRPKSPVRRGGGPSRGGGGGGGRGQGYGNHSNLPNRPRPPRYDSNQHTFPQQQYQQYPQQYPQHHHPHGQQMPQMRDPMQMQMQLQMQMQMQMQQAQMMAAMNINMMDPAMRAQAQAQVQAQAQAQAMAMQLQMQQAQAHGYQQSPPGEEYNPLNSNPYQQQQQGYGYVNVGQGEGAFQRGQQAQWPGGGGAAPRWGWNH